MDDGVQRADSVGVCRDLPDLGLGREVPNDALGAAVQQVLYRGDALRGPRMHDHFVAVPQQRVRRCQAKSIGGAGDEDACHGEPSC